MAWGLVSWNYWWNRSWHEGDEWRNGREKSENEMCSLVAMVTRAYMWEGKKGPEIELFCVVALSAPALQLLAVLPVCVCDVITGESCDLHTRVPSVSSCLVRELKGWPACSCLKAQILKSETANCWLFLFVFTLCLSKLFGSVLFPATLFYQYFSKPCHYLEL